MNSEGSKSHYLNRANAREYFEARRGLRGDFLFQKLCRYVGRGSSVLELGSGPGNDLPLLSKFFKITASDYSPHFVEFIKEDHPGIEALQLDAVAIDTDLRFDAIYSNKVLHHFGSDKISQSLGRQSAVLTAGGLMIHSFWLGTGSTVKHGLHFNKFSMERILELFEPHGEILDFATYAELNQRDSAYVALRIGGDR